MSTKKAQKKETANTNQPYEEWKVDVRKEDGVYHFEQRKKIKTVFITHATADRLNTQTRNSGVKYYPVEGDK